MKKIQLVDFLLVLFAFIFVVSFPFNLFIKDDITLIYAEFSFKLLFIFVVLYYIKPLFKDTYKKKASLSDLVFLPFILISFSNIVVAILQNSKFTFSFSESFILELILLLVSVFIEEYIFRYLSFKMLYQFKPLNRIIISSLIFGLMHFLNFLSTFDPQSLIQVAYTVGLGLILGFIFEFTNNNFLFVFMFHVMFNFFNDFIITRVTIVKFDSIFLTISLSFAGFFIIYGLLSYINIRKLEK